MTDAKERAGPGLLWRAQTNGSTLVVRFEGALDIAVLTECVTGLAEPLAGREPVVEFDLSELAFADSSALRFLIDTKQNCEARGKRFVVTKCSRPVDRLFEVSGLTEWFVGNGDAPH